jgi:sarcosine reductase
MFELASFPARLLRVGPDRIHALAEAEKMLASVTVTLVEPGSAVRLIHVLDAVEPRVRPDGRAAFPTDAWAGRGRTNRLDGVSVLSSCTFRVERTLQQRECVVDMAGPGAEVTPFGSMRVVHLAFEPAAGQRNDPVDAAIRRVTLATAEFLAEPTLEAEPADVERYELGPFARDLSRVVALVQLSDLGSLYSQYYYGTPVGHAGLPKIVDPAELLDGAITSGEYAGAATRNPTHFFQRNALVRALYREHGQRLAFAGLVLMRGYEQTSDGKRTAAERAAALALNLGAEGAIITTDARGNSHTDVMLTCRACEYAGVKTVVVLAEDSDADSTQPVLTDWVVEADAIVSTGKVAFEPDAIVSTGTGTDEVEDWVPERVLGGDRLLDGREARNSGPMSYDSYLGAANQMGQLDFGVKIV